MHKFNFGLQRSFRPLAGGRGLAANPQEPDPAVGPSGLEQSTEWIQASPQYFPQVGAYDSSDNISSVFTI